jgi:hypothetical protein
MNTHNNDETVVLDIFNDLAAAAFAQSKLKEQGIKSFIHDENVIGLNPLGGIELKIFSRDIERAKNVLSDNNP